MVAKSERTSRAGRGSFAQFFVRHVQTAVAALGRLARTPFSSLFTLLVIAITLTLPAGLHLLVKNALQLSGGWESAVDFSVYLQRDIDTETAATLAKIIESRADVETVTVISAGDALNEFKASSGFGDALDSLDKNPLPATLLVRPAIAGNTEAVDLLKQELENLPETDIVQLDTEWVQRFHTVLELLQRGTFLIGAMLALAVLVVIGNTVRLDIQNRREEIEITKLIGANDAFIRRPFLYYGFWSGLLGGLLALGLIVLALWLAKEPVGTLAGLYASNYQLQGLDLRETGIVIGGGAALGLIGSWIAATRHMRRIEPK